MIWQVHLILKSRKVKKLQRYSSAITIIFYPKHYAFGLASVDNNRFRTDRQRIIGAVGYGYKILRTERIKASNEFSICTIRIRL